MGADSAVSPDALAHARLAASVRLVPRATIAEMVGLTMRELQREGTALGIPAAPRPDKRPKGAEASALQKGLRRKLARPHPQAVRVAKPRRTHGEGASFEARLHQAPRGEDVGDQATSSPIDRLAVGRAMERFIARRIAAYEASGTDDPEPEKTARTIAHYARALGLARNYLADIEKEAESDAAMPVRSLSDLRDELHRHLERIWDEDEDAGGLEGPGADAP